MRILACGLLAAILSLVIWAISNYPIEAGFISFGIFCLLDMIGMKQKADIEFKELKNRARRD